MTSRSASLVALLVTVMAASVATRQLPPGYVDPAPVLDAAAKAIGTANLRCVTISGTAYAGAVGQQRESARNVDWPRIDALANYTRTMDWEHASMKEEFDRKPGLNPASWKYGVRWIDGPLQREAHQVFTVKDNYAWHMDGPAAAPVASTPDLAEIYQLDLWLNPHGFLKAARLPGANPRATWRWELGEMGRDGPEVKPERVTVVSITVNGKFRVDATINKEHMLQRIHTWVADPVLGDMNYEHEFTNASYVDLGSGIRFPTEWHSHQGWDDNYGTQAESAGHNAFGGSLKDIRANQCPGTVEVPEPVRRATFPVQVETTKLADGVYLLGGGTHNSMAVEFRDFIAVFEAPLERRAQPCGDRRDRQGYPGETDPLAHQLASALRSCRRPARLHAHRRHDRDPRQELRLLRSRRAQLRAADAEARHGVAVATDRTGRRIFL